MTLNELSLRQKDQLADLYRRRGVVTLREVDLPDSFTSAKSDVVFLRVDTQCEVYVSAAVAYCGQSRA